MRQNPPARRRRGGFAAGTRSSATLSLGGATHGRPLWNSVTAAPAARSKLEAHGAAFPEVGDRATMEETAFGLLALRHTLRAGVEPALLTRTRDAAVRAHGWLSAARAGRATGGPNGEFPDLWAAKLSYAPPHLIEAVVIASLYAPLPS